MQSRNDIILEVCTDRLNHAIAAQNAGASQLEICASLVEGGITPPLSMIEAVCYAVKIPVRVMIRPRGGDFLYTAEEFKLMKQDITHASAAGAAGVVLGVLNPDGSVDSERCRELVALADPMQVTFHRAFDMTTDPFLALEEIIALGCDTVLTSGHRQTAEDGLELIRELVKRAAGRIEILAGGGVNPGNIMLLYEAGVRAFHFTARRKSDGGMKYRNPSLQSMGRMIEVDEYSNYLFDDDKIRNIINIIPST